MRTVLPAIENALPAWNVADPPASTDTVLPTWAKRPNAVWSVRFPSLSIATPLPAIDTPVPAWAASAEPL